MKSYDIAVVGAGIIGLAFAAQFANSSLRVLIVDGKAVEENELIDGYDLRVSAITRASQKLFEQLAVWQNFKRVSPYSKMRVWDATGRGDIHFDCAEIHEENLGHIIENSVMRSALIEKIKQADNVTIQAPIEMKALKDKCLILANGDEIHCQLIIGADGANSWVREQAKIELTQRSYGHFGIVATVKTEHSHQATAWQRFMPKGPLAFLPLPESNYCSIVWSADEEYAKQLLALSDESFIEQLQRASEQQLGNIQWVSNRMGFPLQMRHAQTYIKPGIALIGDAAHTIHPLAGQGLNLGLADAQCLAEFILEAHHKHRNFASDIVLRRYQRCRKPRNQLMIIAMDAFKNLFGNEQPLLTQMRNWGLSTTDKLSFVKKFLIAQALGN